MSLSSYSDLTTSIANWLHRGDLTSIIPDLVTLAENRINREVRTRAMEATLSGTISNGVIAVPADYLSLKFAYLTTAPYTALRGASPIQVYNDYPNRTSADKPKLIAREGSNFIFGPYPDGNYSIGGVYYAKPDALSSSVNNLFTQTPELYLFASLLAASPFLKDDARLQTWETLYQGVLASLTNADNEEIESGGGLTVTVA